MILGVIVEGHGEVQAAPTLLRRLANNIDPTVTMTFVVRRIPKSQLLQTGQLERAVEALTRQIGRHRPILVRLDADYDCPKTLASTLRERCTFAHADVAISVVIANREYEAWFVAAAKSLAGHRGLKEDLVAPADPESIRGAKEWLTAQMAPSRSYSETRHQAAYSALMDLSEARRTRSFRKLEKDLTELLASQRE